MASSAGRPSSRTLSGRPPSSSGGGRYSGRETAGGGSRDLLSREEEYMRLNAELEAKTATLIQEAEEVMREQDSILNHSFNRPHLTSDLADGDNASAIYETEPTGVSDDISKLSLIAPANLDKRRPGSRGRPDTAGSRGAPAKAANKINRRSKSRATSAASVAEDVAIPNQGMDNFSLGDTITNIERRVESGQIDDYCEMDDVVPQATEGIGSEAMIRFLKAKLRVMQEELDNLSQECNEQEESNAKLESQLKEFEDERTRLNRSHQSQASQIEKYKKLAEEAKRKNNGLETQLTGLRKELESMKRSQKSSASTHSATEVRLNRALEEVEKYKSELQRAKVSSRESSDGDKKRTEQLMGENRRLEKQKNELMAGFKKQLKLIDVLKKQKMHIEAAKMLSFTEEEFVKALEWGS